MDDLDLWVLMGSQVLQAIQESLGPRVCLDFQDLRESLVLLELRERLG
jgi:hypothetical protein